jgi:hypothetical protein
MALPQQPSSKGANMEFSVSLGLSTFDSARRIVEYDVALNSNERVTLRLLRPIEPGMSIRDAERDVLKRAQELIADMLAAMPPHTA